MENVQDNKRGFRGNVGSIKKTRCEEATESTEVPKLPLCFNFPAREDGFQTAHGRTALFCGK